MPRKTLRTGFIGWPRALGDSLGPLVVALSLAGPSLYHVDTANPEEDDIMAPKPPAPLIDHIVQGKCVLFAGAGLSMQAGLPCGPRFCVTSSTTCPTSERRRPRSWAGCSSAASSWTWRSTASSRTGSSSTPCWSSGYGSGLRGPGGTPPRGAYSLCRCGHHQL